MSAKNLDIRSLEMNLIQWKNFVSLDNYLTNLEQKFVKPQIGDNDYSPAEIFQTNYARMRDIIRDLPEREEVLKASFPPLANSFFLARCAAIRKTCLDGLVALRAQQ